MGTWLTRVERWIPGAAALLWWSIFYPGLFGDDSLIHLTDARIDHVPVWFTAWWIYVVDFVSIGTRAIPLLTLAGVFALAYAAYCWIAVVFPAGRARAITVLAIVVSPVVGAMGIQVRHDAPMTAALLLCAAVLSRTWNGAPLNRYDVAFLALAALMLPTRHNGVPTIAVSALVLLAMGRRHRRQAAAMLGVAAAAWVITWSATRASGNTSAVHPGQTVEWVMGDISCLLSNAGVDATESEWSTLERIATRTAWPQAAACVAMNPILRDASFSMTAVETHYDDLVSVWRSLASRYPLLMLRAHATRVRLHLPPFVGGPPEVVSFLHSTILPNDFGLEWKFPSIAERARVVIRAWNAMSYVLGNSALWLMVLMLLAWQQREYRAGLMPAIIIGTVLNLGLIAAAPISEGRYGLFILLAGQAAAWYFVLTPRPAAPPSPGHAAPSGP
jgi:hypothetical protein